MYEILHANRIFNVIDKDGHFVVAEPFECNGAMVAPRDAEGNYCLVEQFRKAIGLVSTEFPRGKHDLGESIERTARRETLEEMGFEVDELVKLGILHTNNSIIQSHMLLFAGIGARQVTKKTDGEVQRVVKYSPDELLTAVASGKITDSHTLSAITYMLANGIFY
ncbi:NUDIX hydrolase [Pseudomonas sp. CFBP 13719]|uniref:NUDIX hydrolase n=1 Tax=Pseudomonas sp. CFBP 13719 TaxID=2775303 RepID=UPI00177EE5EC|nr:NUDIX hydrolase [Pseudomonas sp. CFBP 13719]MBD8614872.1 NUDIX hydrolase [Pseudomonas putida]MBD8681444.1 NUDIX hydrolase [Pseudomonas sp. CFBP 13719]